MDDSGEELRIRAFDCILASQRMKWYQELVFQAVLREGRLLQVRRLRDSYLGRVMRQYS